MGKIKGEESGWWEVAHRNSGNREKRDTWHFLWDSYKRPPSKRRPQARSGAGFARSTGWERHSRQTDCRGEAVLLGRNLCPLNLSMSEVLRLHGGRKTFQEEQRRALLEMGLERCC